MNIIDIKSKCSWICDGKTLPTSSGGTVQDPEAPSEDAVQVWFWLRMNSDHQPSEQISGSAEELVLSGFLPKSR